jgi:hypothetical protein
MEEKTSLFLKRCEGREEWRLLDDAENPSFSYVFSSMEAALRYAQTNNIGVKIPKMKRPEPGA